MRIAIVEPADAGVMLAPSFAARGAETIIVTAANHRPLRNVTAVVAGSERAVNRADALSEALGCPTNGTALSAARRDKSKMIEAVAAHGLRVPAQFRATALEPLLEWASARAAVVIKPLHAAGSDGVRLCRSRAEIERAFKAIHGATNVLSLVNEAVLAQEMIGGDEYVVDTVSWDGEHHAVAFWRYRKPPPDYASVGVFTTKELLPPDGAIASRLFAYVRGVLDALGIRFGPGHCEVKIDEQGPVLIELGARLHGGPKAHEMCRAATGSSQLDLVVDAYTDSARFRENAARVPRLERIAVMRLVRPPRSGALKPRAATEVARLRSAHDVSWNAADRYTAGSVAGLAILMHDDRDVVERDLRALEALEQDGLFSLR